MTPAPARVHCTHRYVLLQDSCPGCDAEQERPHPADPVTVRPAWATRDMYRCRRCTLPPSARIHRAGSSTGPPTGEQPAEQPERRTVIELLLARAQRGVLTQAEAGRLADAVRAELHDADTRTAAGAAPCHQPLPPEAQEVP